jgi:hypothetical protein
MADEEVTPSSGYTAAPSDQSDSDSSGESAPSFAPDHDSDTPQPAPGADDKVIRPDEIRAQHDEINKALHGVLEQSRANRNDEAMFTKELQDLKEQADKQQAEPPVPTAPPAPPDQQQKNTIAVLGTNILKWTALVGLAYGMTRRSPNRSAMFTLALGAALKGYYDGNKDQRDRSISVWEKNRQAIQDQNRAQHTQYEETLQNNRLSLAQKMDVLKEQSSLWGNKRMEDGAARKDITAIQTAMNQEIHMERDFETQMRRDREQWYKQIGLGGKDGEVYREWIQKQGGPDISKAKDADEAHAIESKYPIYKMLDEQAKDKRAQDVETASKKSAAEARAKREEEQSGAKDKQSLEVDTAAKKAAAEERARYEEKQREEKEEEGAGTKDNPLGLNLGN